MNIPITIEEDRRKTKRCARIVTVIYLVLFPFLFLFAATSVMIFDSPGMSLPFGLPIIFLYFCIPLSIPFTFYFVWSRYSQGEYKKSRRFCLLPVYIFIIVSTYSSLISPFLH